MSSHATQDPQTEIVRLKTANAALQARIAELERKNLTLKEPAAKERVTGTTSFSEGDSLD